VGRRGGLRRNLGLGGFLVLLLPLLGLPLSLGLGLLFFLINFLLFLKAFHLLKVGRGTRCSKFQKKKKKKKKNEKVSEEKGNSKTRVTKVTYNLTGNYPSLIEKKGGVRCWTN